MAVVENFGSGCNRPLHLRAVCGSCSRTKSFGDSDFVQKDSVTSLLGNFRRRIDAVEPVRTCDDPATWDWRAYMRGRRLELQSLAHYAEMDGIDKSPT